MDFMNLRAAAQIAFLRTGLPDDWAPARVLDVGCSAGSMLVALSATAGRLTGYEPDVQMARFAAHRLPTADIRATVCDPADLPAGEFDLITMSHVLEHVPTPVEFVRGLLRALAPGGRLFVEVPNEVPDELDALIRYGYRGHVHLSFFTPPTLVRCVEAAGGRVLRLRTAGPSFRDGSPVTELVRATATSRPKRPLIIRAARLLARPVSRGLRFRSAPPIPAPHPWNTLFAKESTDPAERIWVRALIEVSE
jgi:SAM-dependent methyltransferase